MTWELIKIKILLLLLLPLCVVAQAPVYDTDGDGIVDRNDPCVFVANERCADFNGNGFVNFADLAYMKSVFSTDDGVADLNDDGVVNFGDLSLLKMQMFQFALSCNTYATAHIGHRDVWQIACHGAIEQSVYFGHSECSVETHRINGDTYLHCMVTFGSGDW